MRSSIDLRLLTSFLLILCIATPCGAQSNNTSEVPPDLILEGLANANSIAGVPGIPGTHSADPAPVQEQEIEPAQQWSTEEETTPEAYGNTRDPGKGVNTNLLSSATESTKSVQEGDKGDGVKKKPGSGSTTGNVFQTAGGGEGEFTPSSPGEGATTKDWTSSRGSEGAEGEFTPSAPGSGTMASTGGISLPIIVGILQNAGIGISSSTTTITANDIRELLKGRVKDGTLAEDAKQQLMEGIDNQDDGKILNQSFLLLFLNALNTLEKAASEAEESETTEPALEELGEQRFIPGWYNIHNDYVCRDSKGPQGVPGRPDYTTATAVSTGDIASSTNVIESLRLFDTSKTFEFFGREWFPTTDNPGDTSYDPHGLYQWQFFCFGNRSECFPIQATELQYGCGGIRARLDYTPGAALFDSPGSPAGQRRIPGLVR